MSGGLFRFIYNTLLEQVNNPNNKTYWLPNRLDQVTNSDGKPMLPIQTTNWDVGNITGNSGSFFAQMIASQWLLYLSGLKPPPEGLKDHSAAGCPTQPWPYLKMPQATINGLDNVFVYPNPTLTESEAGYHAIVTLQFGYYNGQNGLPTLSQIQVQGQYSISQCICSLPAEGGNQNACDGWKSEQVNGEGTFSVTLTDAFIDATVDIQVEGTGPERTLKVVIDNLTMRGPQPGALPSVAVDDLTLDSKLWISKTMWIPDAKTAITSPDGVTGIVANINTTLNQPDNISQIEKMLTTQLNNILDQTLGAVPAGQLPSGIGQQAPNPVDQYLFDRVRFMMNSPQSDYYLPKVVYGFSDPQLEPFQAQTISLGSQSYDGMVFQSVDLNNVTITGLSNVIAPEDKLVFQGPNVNATFDFSTLNPPPQVTIDKDGSKVTVQVPAPPMSVTGQFAMTPDGGDEPLTGGIIVTVAGSSLAVTTNFSGDVIDDLQITFTQMELSAASNNITVTADIDSAFKQMVNEILNQDSVKQTFITGINNVASQQLSSISKTATNNAKQIVKSRLGG